MRHWIALLTDATYMVFFFNSYIPDRVFFFVNVYPKEYLQNVSNFEVFIVCNLSNLLTLYSPVVTWAYRKAIFFYLGNYLCVWVLCIRICIVIIYSHIVNVMTPHNASVFENLTVAYSIWLRKKMFTLSVLAHISA